MKEDKKMVLAQSNKSENRRKARVKRAERLSHVNSRLARRYCGQKIMDVGGNGSGLPVNNKQRAMLPNKSRGEFTRNPRKDSEVREHEFGNNFFVNFRE